MKKYKYLIFDADHTLLNFIADERSAFIKLYETLGMEITDTLLSQSRKHSEETWTEAGMYDVHAPEIQTRYHEIYRAHVAGVFEKIFSEFSYTGGVSPEEAGKRFLKNLEGGGAALCGAEEILRKLSDKTGGEYCVCIATNGLSSIQRGRLRRWEGYARKLYISEEVGAIKPLKEFFDRILFDLHAKPSECLMIGDSLASDIAGAKAAGMDACWCNFHGAENTTSLTPDYEIFRIEELSKIL